MLIPALGLLPHPSPLWKYLKHVNTFYTKNATSIYLTAETLEPKDHSLRA